MAGLLVVLMSTEKNLGFAFPAADIELGTSVELSRLFYAIGLLAAGIVSDRDRHYGALCCLVSLVIPFAMLALASEPLPSMALWSLNYLVYGFFSVFRVVLFTDLAITGGSLCIAGFGLMWGRVGDAAGSALCLALGDNVIALVAVTAVSLVGTIVVALPVLRELYQPASLVILLPPEQPPEQPPAPQDSFALFVERYDLSRREQEVLREVLDRHTNVEAAEALFVSESTIKFHVRNILRKTGCSNRTELRTKYADERKS